MSNATPWMNHGRPSSRWTIFASQWNQTTLTVARDHAIHRAQRFAREQQPGRLARPARLVLGMDLLIPADRIFEPFRLREAERRLDVRTDVGLAGALVEKGHEHDRRQLLDQRLVAIVHRRLVAASAGAALEGSPGPNARASACRHALRPRSTTAGAAEARRASMPLCQRRGDRSAARRRAGAAAAPRRRRAVERVLGEPAQGAHRTCRRSSALQTTAASPAADP